MAATPLSMKEAQPAPSVEEIVRTLVQVVPTPVLVVDADLHPVYVNPAASELLGGGDEALVGSDLMDFLVRRERDEVSSYLRSSATDQPGRRSMTVLDRNGQEREVVLHHTRLELGGQRLLAGIIEDVTETRRVRREAVALAQSAASLGINRSLDATLEALAQSVVETTSAIACGVYLLERDGNLRTAGTFGLPPGYAAAADAAQKRGAPRAAIRAMEAHATVIDEDVVSRCLADPRFAPLHDLIREVPWSVIVSLPLMHHDAAIGALKPTIHQPSGHPKSICRSSGRWPIRQPQRSTMRACSALPERKWLWKSASDWRGISTIPSHRPFMESPSGRGPPRSCWLRIPRYYGSPSITSFAFQRLRSRKCGH